MNTPAHSQQLDSIYKTLNELSLSELNKVLHEINLIRKKKVSSVLSKKESQLLKTINKPLPEEFQNQYIKLIEKKNQEILTESEYEELLKLTAIAETITNKRLESIIELAQIKSKTFDEIVGQLELKPLFNES